MKKTSLFPSGPINKVQGTCIYLQGNDIDTDRIIPARFLKCINFEDLGDQVFADDRKEEKGLHPFDISQNSNSSILIVNKNFGCGSSREHAPQALMRWGIRAIIGESFAEIFYGNCLSIGIPCAIISESDIKGLINKIRDCKNKEFTIDLNTQKITLLGESWKLKIDNAALESLLSGSWDATSILVNELERVDRTKAQIPYLNNFKNSNEINC